MPSQVEINSVCPRIHQPLEPFRARGIIAFKLCRIQKQPLAEIMPDCIFSLGLSSPPERGEGIRLHPVKVILALRVNHSEHGIGIVLPVHMGDAPIISGYGPAFGLLGPSHCIALWS